MIDGTKNTDKTPVQPSEIEETMLDDVAGGAARTGGDDDLDDLEVERLRRR